MDDTLLHLSRAPAFVEGALRDALREMFDLRALGGATCDARDFVRLALARSQRAAGHDDAPDALARHEREAAVVRAAARFAGSRLGHRLRTIALAKIVRAPAGIDVAVRDRRGMLHYVRLETYAESDRLDAVARAVRTMESGRPGLRPSLHFFSLRDGVLRSYPALAARSRAATRGPLAAVA